MRNLFPLFTNWSKPHFLTLLCMDLKKKRENAFVSVQNFSNGYTIKNSFFLGGGIQKLLILLVYWNIKLYNLLRFYYFYEFSYLMHCNTGKYIQTTLWSSRLFICITNKINLPSQFLISFASTSSFWNLVACILNRTAMIYIIFQIHPLRHPSLLTQVSNTTFDVSESANNIYDSSERTG